MNIQVGMKAVCVDTSDRNFGDWPSFGTLDGLTRGRIYTIRAIGDYRGFPCVWLEEIARASDSSLNGEVGYSVRRFCPVIERKTDISVFTVMLTPSPTKREPVASNHDVTALNDVLRRSIARMTAKLRFEGEIA